MGRSAFVWFLALVATGCIGREVAEVEPNQNKEQYKDIPVLVNRDIDILFLIDNSGSMTEEQASLVANFNRFINVLETIEGGLPNVHIGVVSTDVGVSCVMLPALSRRSTIMFCGLAPAGTRAGS